MESFMWTLCLLVLKVLSVESFWVLGHYKFQLIKHRPRLLNIWSSTYFLCLLETYYHSIPEAENHSHVQMLKRSQWIKGT